MPCNAFDLFIQKFWFCMLLQSDQGVMLQHKKYNIPSDEMGEAIYNNEN